MAIIEDENDILKQIREELARYIKSGSKSSFIPTSQASQTLSQLLRELERKRQSGSLTAAEAQKLREIDELLEDIAKFNRKNQDTAPLGGHPVYNLADQKLSEATEYVPPMIVPNVSGTEAQEIISELDQQFEEKVLSKLRKKAGPDSLTGPASGGPEDFSISKGPAEEGRSLQEHLANVKAEVPNLPFMDEDSHFDLSKLKGHAGVG